MSEVFRPAYEKAPKLAEKKENLPTLTTDELVKLRDAIQKGLDIQKAYKEITGISARPLMIYEAVKRSGARVHPTFIVDRTGIGRGTVTINRAHMKVLQRMCLNHETSINDLLTAYAGMTDSKNEMFDRRTFYNIVKRTGYRLVQTISLPKEEG